MEHWIELLLISSKMQLKMDLLKPFCVVSEEIQEFLLISLPEPFTLSVPDLPCWRFNLTATLLTVSGIMQEKI